MSESYQNLGFAVANKLKFALVTAKEEKLRHRYLASVSLLAVC